MSDYERYSDSDHRDNTDDALYPVPRWIRVMKLLLRVAVILLCLATVGVLVFRLIFAGWYPKDFKRLHMTDALRAAYAERGSLEAWTQDLAVPYEDRTTGYFRADNLIFLKDPGALQCTLRINRASYADIAKAAGVKNPEQREGFLSFSLYYGGEGAETVTASPSAVLRETHLYYDYYKLCFDGLSFADKNGKEIPWYRLNIHVAGSGDTEDAPDACIVVYENNEEYSDIRSYIISEEEYAQ